MSVLIIGAGVAGLSVARELAQAGEQVVVVDSGAIGGGVSGAATAYLEPRLGDAPMKRLEQDALHRWTAYAAALEDGFGSIGFRKQGQLRVALAPQADAFDRDMARRATLGWRVERIAPARAHGLVPVLSPDLAAAAFLPDVRSVDGRAVCQALAHAVRGAGGTIYEHRLVERIDETKQGLVLAGPSGPQLTAETVMLATGHRAAPIHGLPEDVPATRPVRGVNLIYDRRDLPVNLFVKHHRGYLCPRGGQVLVGTSYENGVTDPVPDAAATERLLANGATIVPDLRDRSLRAVSAGIRAKVGDGLPSFGRSRHMRGLCWSLGHAGAGYLRAPVFAPELAAWLQTGTPGPWLTRTKLV